MEYKWELHFAEPGMNSRDKIRVTLNTKGLFYLNPVALKALGEPDAVQVMFDRRQAVIGILRTSIEKKGAFLLKRKLAQGPGSGKCFYAGSFCKKYKLYPKEIKLFTDAHVDRDGILILDLNQMNSARRQKRETAE